MTEGQYKVIVKLLQDIVFHLAKKGRGPRK